MSDVSHIKTVLGVREKVIDNCWAYLYDNFHKFTEPNKLKVILAICPKNIPQKIEGVSPQQTVIMGDIRLKDGKPLRYDIGNRIPSEALADPGEAVPGN
jgi:hypothetical protein